MKDLKKIEVFLFDMDGTLCMGDVPFAGVFDTLRKLEKAGKSVWFVTNNSSKSRNDYIKKFKKMGYGEVRVEQIISSSLATAQYISRYMPYKSVFVLGADCLKQEFRDYGIEVKEIGEDADILVLAFDTELTYKKLFHATNLVHKGAKYIATHPDFMCPSDEGDMPDAGALIAAVAATTGKKPDIIVGKPHYPIAEYVFDHCNADAEHCCFIGDRLYTDIKFGINNKMATVAVLSGETTLEMLSTSDIRPDFVLESVNDLIGLI